MNDGTHTPNLATIRNEHAIFLYEFVMPSTEQYQTPAAINSPKLIPKIYSKLFLLSQNTCFK
jgi:hypothetical protein